VNHDEFKNGNHHDSTDKAAQDAKIVDFQTATSGSEILTSETFALLEERLMVNLTRRKLGEIVVRKEIETHILQVQVPIRSEKLIVEQISPEYKLLSEVELGRSNASELAISNAINDGVILAKDGERQLSIGLDDLVDRQVAATSTQPRLGCELDSVEAARALLNEIAKLSDLDDCGSIRLEIVLKDDRRRDIYQSLFDLYCKRSI
jgi:Domain of unknown function (DUF2382)